MASVSISSSLQRLCSFSTHARKQQRYRGNYQHSMTNEATSVDVLTQKMDGQEGHPHAPETPTYRSKHVKVKMPEDSRDEVCSAPKFTDEQWKNGTWDLNMFVKNGRMDWDGVIIAEARRRRFLELFPESATNQEPVLFRSSIIPWWAWIWRSHLPEAELLNGRAAMIGFFMVYFVDALTGLDVVGQTGNFVCKAGLFLTVIVVMLLRKSQDFRTMRKLADEATFYDRQWKASWESDDSKTSSDSVEKNL